MSEYKTYFLEKLADDLKRISFETEVALAGYNNEDFPPVSCMDAKEYKKYSAKKRQLDTLIQKYEETYGDFDPALTEQAILAATFGQWFRSKEDFKQFCIEEDIVEGNAPLQPILDGVGDKIILSSDMVKSEVLADGEVLNLYTFSRKGGMKIHILLTKDANGYKQVQKNMPNDIYFHRTTFNLDPHFIKIDPQFFKEGLTPFTARYLTILHAGTVSPYRLHRVYKEF